jgi:hypothetical protein
MTAEAALKLVETEPVEEKALSIVDQAKAVKVTDAQTYTAAGSLWKQIGDMIKEVKDTFDPICDAAHKAHKAAVEKRAKYLDPLTAVQKSVKGLMSAYDAEQERIRREEQARLAEIARKAAEEQALLDAIAAEEEAKRNGATKEEAAQEAEAVMAEPVYVPPVVLPKATPKLQGGPVYKTAWKFRIVDANKIPRQYMVPDEKAIGAIVRSTQGRIEIPGVEAYSERV